MARRPAAQLPAAESLLADKAEHIIERGAQDRIPADNPWGFKLKVPEHLYNRGELYNLSVARGTLTDEERYKINDHIVQTIIMLTKLPFPKHLKSVPELAGGHHERMDGNGYPKQLPGGGMSVQARIMAVAQRPISLNAFTTVVTGTPAWKNIPSWAVHGTADHAIHPDAERDMAKRAGTEIVEIDGGSHAVAVSQPKRVADVILRAVKAAN